MQFTPKQLEENVNVSKSHPLTELLWLLGGLILLSALLFFFLGITADWAVSKTPIKVETWIGQLALNALLASPLIFPPEFLVYRLRSLLYCQPVFSIAFL